MISSASSQVSVTTSQ
jgi:tRNA nucleotidyltransferase/poly(A) polymerase